MACQAQASDRATGVHCYKQPSDAAWCAKNRFTLASSHMPCIAGSQPCCVCCVQALHQLAGLASTLVIAILGGLLVGTLVKYSDCVHQKMGEEHFFEDAVFWHEVVDEEGELGHTVANGEA